MTEQDLTTTADGQLDAVTRSVTTTDNGRTFSIVAGLSQSYDTDIDDLWEACTTADRLARWFAPVTGDLKLGGTYQIEGNAGGTVKSCDPPHGYTLSWEFGGEVSELTVRLESLDSDRSRLTIEHGADVAADRWTEYGPGSVGIGWDLGLLGLAHHLTTGASAPAESTQWVHTDQAQHFMSDSSRRWADAAVSAGTPEALARAFEMRTTAFYLGTEGDEA
ncbi:SRPBCC domain-containing protein [Williamsia sp. 1135]|uniref:SRPBCC domain-containing protein n=1 Tax=Williamsia sp. 1135 TaxID=1889262 RepID=UPI000A11AA2A|nr:SRPBCC domain-containing protein [Williamsia sp. 1135]ORM31819.1 polyketide cyclase [Williamsia sp. 1135]